MLCTISPCNDIQNSNLNAFLFFKKSPQYYKLFFKKIKVLCVLFYNFFRGWLGMLKKYIQRYMNYSCKNPNQLTFVFWVPKKSSQFSKHVVRRMRRFSWHQEITDAHWLKLSPKCGVFGYRYMSIEHTMYDWNSEQKNRLLWKLFCCSSDFYETWLNYSTHG